MKSIITNIKKTTKNVVANTKDLIEGDETRPANWEAQEAVSYCRNCDVKFDLAKKELWKHHCRKCGNVVCEECLQRSAADNKKYCLGCVRGEVPGDELVEILTEMMREAADPNSKKQSKLKARRVIDKGIAQMTNMFDGEEQTPVARRIRLRRGSMYGEDGRDPHNRAPLAISGYFEFLNKSTSVCCIKLLYGGGDYLYEAPRPSYTAGAYR